MRSTTPPGEPPQIQTAPTPQTSYQDVFQGQQAQHHAQHQAQQAQQANAASTVSLLQALANMSKSTKPTPTPVLTPPQPHSQPQSTASIVSPPQLSAIPVVPSQSQQANGLPPNVAGLLPPHLSGALSSQQQQPPQQSLATQPQTTPFTSLMPQPNVGAVDPNIQGQMALLQLLLQQPGFANLPMNQLGPALGPLLGLASAQGGGMPAWQQQMSQQPQQQQPSAQQDNRFDDRNARERGRYSPPSRSPYRRRSRSRSPGYIRRESPLPFRRRSPTYDDYGNESFPRGSSREPETSHSSRGGRARGTHARRGSPDRRRRDRSGSPPPRNQRNGGRSGDSRFDAPDIPSGPKFIEHDSTLPKDHIKVYSRTLFVGGVA